MVLFNHFYRILFFALLLIILVFGSSLLYSLLFFQYFFRCPKNLNKSTWYVNRVLLFLSRSMRSCITLCIMCILVRILMKSNTRFSVLYRYSLSACCFNSFKLWDFSDICLTRRIKMQPQWSRRNLIKLIVFNCLLFDQNARNFKNWNIDLTILLLLLISVMIAIFFVRLRSNKYYRQASKHFFTILWFFI